MENTNSDDFSDIAHSLVDLFENEKKQAGTESHCMLESLKESSQQYIIKELVGSGGVKNVYCVHDVCGRRVLAMALPNKDTDQEQIEKFVYEAWLTGQLDHPNIIKIHELSINDDNIPFFTMDLKAGMDLKELLTQLHAGNQKLSNFFTQKKLLEVFEKVCDAVSYAHSQHILHLDLKPANIQVGEHGEVVICDWGLAQVTRAKYFEETDKELLYSELIDKNNNNYIQGTPGFMAPEQMNGGTLNEYTDIYGLGAILYTILTLTPPLPPEYTGKLDQSLFENIPAPQKVCGKKISDSLAAIAMKCLATDPSDRYASVQDLKNDIEKYQRGFTTGAEPDNIFKEVKLFYRRNKIICIQALVFLLVAIAGAASFIVNLQQSWSQELDARQKAEKALGMYKQEKASSALLKRDFTWELIHSNQIFVGKRFYNDPRKVLLTSLKGYEYNIELKPLGTHAKKMKGIALFILQRYDEAYHYIYSIDELKELRPAIDAAREYNYEYNGVVPPRVLSAVINAMRTNPKRGIILRTLAYDRQARNDYSNYELVVKALTHFLNRNWEGEFSYTPKTKTLNLSGNNCRRISMGDSYYTTSILEGLPISHLNLSNTSIRQLAGLENIPISTIDIRKTRVSNLSPLRRIESLRKLIVNPGQFEDQQLKNLIAPPDISIVKHTFQ